MSASELNLRHIIYFAGEELNNTRMAITRVHTSAKAVDATKLLLLNTHRVTDIVPCGICQ